MQPTIKIGHLQNPDWKAATSESYKPVNTTVWRAAVNRFNPNLERLKETLRPEETEKAMRFHQEADRQRYTISKYVLRVLLGKYLDTEPKQIRFRLGKNKKPELENSFPRKIYFNISHSGNWVLIAISNKEIGVDVEETNASFTWQNLLPFSVSDAEKAFIESSYLPWQSFYQLWTRKESLLKATGKGLVDELSRIPSLIGVHQNPIEITGSVEDWQVLSFPVDENHAGSVAFMPVKTAVQFFNFQL